MSLLFKPCSHNLELCKRLADILKQVAQLYRKQAASTSDALDQLYREALFKSWKHVTWISVMLFCCRSTKASYPRRVVMLRSSPITCARRSA